MLLFVFSDEKFINRNVDKIDLHIKPFLRLLRDFRLSVVHKYGFGGNFEEKTAKFR